MIVRKGAERGRTRTDWLDSWHSFSFGDYRDPDHNGFSVLRVINEDIVAPDSGFAMHPHRDMEILTYVISGQLAHRDSLGNDFIIGPGELQRMTAGRGIRHSEMNPSATDPVHLLQIWILPDQKGLAPGYEQKRLVDPARMNEWQQVASPEADGGSLKVHQDVRLYAARIKTGLPVEVRQGRAAWVQVVQGALQEPVRVQAGDGLAFEEAGTYHLAGEAELLWFDLPSTGA